MTRETDLGTIRPTVYRKKRLKTPAVNVLKDLYTCVTHTHARGYERKRRCVVIVLFAVAAAVYTPHDDVNIRVLFISLLSRTVGDVSRQRCRRRRADGILGRPENGARKLVAPNQWWGDRGVIVPFQ